MPVSRPRARLLLALAGLAVLSSLAPTASAAPSSASLRSQLQETLERLDAAEDRATLAQDELVKVERAIVVDNAAIKAVQTRLARRARMMYAGGLGGDLLEVMITSDDPEAVISRISLLEAATRDDAGLLRASKALRRTLEERRQHALRLRDTAQSSERAVLAESARLQRLLGQVVSAEDAAADAAAERARERRRTTAARASRAGAGAPRLSGRYACPVGPQHAFRNTWGAPRSGGRRHKGTDIMAPYGAPAYAVTDGRVTRTSWSTNGGLGVYLRGNDGHEYYYAHMSSAVVRSGSVRVGQLIARVGDSGNARGTPHIHFELHQGGGSAVNPYFFLSRLC